VSLVFIAQAFYSADIQRPHQFIDVLADDYTTPVPLLRAALLGYDVAHDDDDAHMPFTTSDFGKL
jgi:hypothetical protein